MKPNKRKRINSFEANKTQEQISDKNTKVMEALERSIAENQGLRADVVKLQNDLSKAEADYTKLLNDFSEVKKQKSSQKKELQKLKHQYDIIQKRYYALSHSKLGRLTLYYWAKQANKSKGTKKFLLFERFFAKIPDTEQLQLQLGINDATAITDTVSKMSPEQGHWLSKYNDIINTIPDSNGCRYYDKLSIKIGIVCDEFYYDSMKAAADFIYITPKNWKNTIDEGIDVLLFVSAWRGLNDEWKGLAALSSLTKSEKRIIALKIIDYCNEISIPTIFYSKEDPPNYELFLEYAKHCRFVFTSAKECVPFYKSDCNNSFVDAITFGINPVIHNPIGSFSEPKEKTVLFSGSWMKKYPDRCKELSTIFDGIIESKYTLKIIDRNYPTNLNYQFPAPYFQYSSPAVDHVTLQKLHKLFNWAVNINSVKTSETMFANRGFELQANGVLLLSNFSVGVNSLLPTIQMIHDSQEVVKVMESMTEEDIYEHKLFGIRSVMTNHTCFDRIKQLLQFTEFNANQPERKILIITVDDDEYFKKNYERQTYQFKSFILQKDLTVEKLTEYDMITWFDSQAYYGEFYLEDMINGFKYTNCDYITKNSYYRKGQLVKGIEHNYVDIMNSKYRTVFWRSSYDAEFFLKSKLPKDLMNGYSIDHYSYIENYKPKKTTKRKYKLSVIIPVYNNGSHLYGKCFTSLQRSSLFKDMEIILVDDGSSDNYTLKVQQYLIEKYNNVISFQFNDGGSGSASRPRNKGVELASSDYITFLDPDNEAICDGYCELYKLAIANDYDLTLGNMLKCDSKTTVADNYGKIIESTGTDEFTNGFENHLIDVNFLSISIQAMVIKKSLIIENNIEQVVGAAGQDTLFSWQLLNCAHRIKALSLPIHIYYAQTAGSVTNLVKPVFFEKLFLLQKPKLNWLLEQKLIEPFMEARYDYYTKNWILKKLSMATQPIECVKLVKRIHDVFSSYYKSTDELINRFDALCNKKKYDEAFRIIQEAFPQSISRPMPTLEEILQNAKKPSTMDIICTQNASNFSFVNKTSVDTDVTYAWVILYAEGAYKKAYSTKYLKNNEFTYDFNSLPVGLFKVRAFIREHSGEKQSEDTAYIRIQDDKTAEFLTLESSAVLSNGGIKND